MTKAAAKGSFKVTSWSEEAYAERPVGRLTRATVRADLDGDMAGSGSVTWLMCYRVDGTADYVGLLDIEATLGGRRGGFVVRTTGIFDGQKAVGPWVVVDGSGRDELAGIRGTGEFNSPHGTEAAYRLTYEFD